MSQENASVASQLNQTAEITADTLNSIKGEERRQFVRRSARWNVTVNTRDKYVIETKTIDISERGASIECPIAIQLGDVILLQIHAFYKGKKASYKVIGEVKRATVAKSGFTLGVFFKNASDEAFNFFRFYAEGRI
jgi:hypothetical protein